MATIFPRRRFLQLAAGATALSASPHIARAQSYPTRPVRIIVGFAAGGPQDIVARFIGQWLSEHLGQQFLIENRAGAAGNIAAEAVARASPDGYTLLLAGLSNAVNASLYDGLSFNFLRDMAPIAGIVRTPAILEVSQTLAVRTVAELIAAAKANPGKINLANTGNGSPSHVYGELFKTMTGVNLNPVPYRGSAPAITGLLGGEVQVFFDGIPSSIEYVRADKLRALAVTTKTRSDALPNVPTVGDFVPGFDASSWYGLAAPKSTPAEIVNRLNKEVNTAIGDPKMKARFADLGGAMLPGSPADFGNLIADETERWAKVVRAGGIKAD
jgi:tripartite-type tricarboxylate transporter receptor subunit TctC